MKSILERRSIRKYTDKPIEKELIVELLKAAMAAPSAGNAQPWEFVVIDDKEIFKAITEIHPYSKMLIEAQYAILVCANIEKEIHKGYWPQDCAAATENILIAAQSLGIGSVWLGVYPDEHRYLNIQRLLDIPSEVIPFSLISLGYSDEEKESANRYDEKKVHINRW